MDTMNLSEACKYLCVSDSTLLTLLGDGSIPGAKIGQSWVLRKSDLDQYLAEQVNRQTTERRELSLAGQAVKVKTAFSNRKRSIADLPKLP